MTATVAMKPESGDALDTIALSMFILFIILAVVCMVYRLNPAVYNPSSAVAYVLLIVLIVLAIFGKQIQNRQNQQTPDPLVDGVGRVARDSIRPAVPRTNIVHTYAGPVEMASGQAGVEPAN